MQLPLAGPPKGLMDCAESWFKERVIGQDHAVSGVVRAIKKARAAVTGLASGQETKPKAVFFFAGPTGVGKTFLSKQLAEYLFDTQEAFLRFDMSEFKEEHTVSKLIGAPPGYVGYEKGGMLTNGVRNHPFSVILFDEIEKAHPKIMDIFLQILDDGRLTDSRGQTVFFTESVIIFTSNIGTRTTTGANVDEKARLDALFQQPDNEKNRQIRIRQHFIDAVHDFFASEISRPELLNRIGSQIIAFNFLDSSEVQQNIFTEKLHEMSTHFRDKFSNLGHRLVFEDGATDYFMEKYGASIKKFGGRGVVNALEDEIGFLIAEQKLWAEHNRLSNITFTVSVDTSGELQCRRTK
jgi:ATP-dependent Clp protease ATP-binding subunit ClpA